MRKFICLALAILMLMQLFAGCTGVNDPGNATTQPTQSSEPSQSETVPTTETPTEAPTEALPRNGAQIIASLGECIEFESTFGCREYIFQNVAVKNEIIGQFTDEGFQVLDVEPIDGAKYETIILNKGEELYTWFAEWFNIRKKGSTCHVLPFSFVDFPRKKAYNILE